MDDISEAGKESPQSIKNIVSDVRDHPFSFGFRHALTHGKAKLHTPNHGENWHISFVPPSVDDPVWWGNCVQDAIISADALRGKLGPGTTTTIQKLSSLHLGNSRFGWEHFRVFVEDPSAGFMGYVDHSNTYNTYFVPENDKVDFWRDLTGEEEGELRVNHAQIDTPLMGLAYEEFDINGIKGLSMLGLYTNKKLGFLICFDIQMPALPKGQTDFRIFFNIEHGALDKEVVTKRVEDGDFHYFHRRPKGAPYFSAPDHKAREDFPEELRATMKIWFKEVVNVLPDELPRPGSDGLGRRLAKKATSLLPTK